MTLCSDGGREHTVPIFIGPLEIRPPELTCTRCGLRFVKDRRRKQGYRAERVPPVPGKQEALLG